MKAPPTWDAVVIGAGAAGLQASAMAGQLGLRVLLIDHAEMLAEKIRISGGGRCNFTNKDAGPANYLSDNPHFCKSALARYTPQAFMALVQKHGVAFHEKHKGQLFCDRSAQDIIDLLVTECEQGQVTRWQPCTVHEVQRGFHVEPPAPAAEQTAGELDGFTLQTDRGRVHTRQLVVATGGLPIPKIGASDFGLRLARQMGHSVIDTRPGLVPLTFDPVTWAPFVALAGLSLPVLIGNAPPKAEAKKRARIQFHEDLLFTHRGLSGPAILQISSHWREGEPVVLNLAPDQIDLGAQLCAAKHTSRRSVLNELAQWVPRRLAEVWLHGQPDLAHTALPDCKDKALQELGRSLQQWTLRPQGTEGYRKAEVMTGGVNTREMHSASMESRLVPGLYFIGEVVDVTGWLGGYNFQWAWSSAAACAHAMAARAQA